jgi:hypothetical protein
LEPLDLDIDFDLDLDLDCCCSCCSWSVVVVVECKAEVGKFVVGVGVDKFVVAAVGVDRIAVAVVEHPTHPLLCACADAVSTPKHHTSHLKIQLEKHHKSIWLPFFYQILVNFGRF